MKTEIKKLLNLSGTIFKFNMRNKKYWIFVYVLVFLSIFLILIGAIVASSIGNALGTGLILNIMPWFNLSSSVLLVLVFIMFSSSPILRDRDLALYDLEKRYGYRVWQITMARLIWIFSMCLIVSAINLTASLLFGIFGAGGSQMIYIKAFVIPSVWNLYLILLVPIVTIFISLIFNVIFGKTVLYAVVLTVALSPAISAIVTVVNSMKNLYYFEDESYNANELAGRTLFDEYFSDMVSPKKLKSDDNFVLMAKEYRVVQSKLESKFPINPIDPKDPKNPDNLTRLGVPVWEWMGLVDAETDFPVIASFYKQIIDVIPKYETIQANTSSLIYGYDSSIFNKYLSKIKDKKFKKSIEIISNITSEWKLMTSVYNEIHEGQTAWNNRNIYNYITVEYTKIYDYSLETMVLNVMLFTIIDEMSKILMKTENINAMSFDSGTTKMPKNNPWLFAINPLNNWSLIFSPPIASVNNKLVESHAYLNLMMFQSNNISFVIKDNKIKTVKIVPAELLIIINFLILFILYLLGVTLWKRKILK